MISPLEIQEKEFSRGLKGFKEDEVNQFLDQITLDLERLLEENRQLKAERDQMAEELKKYETTEGSIVETLETAKALMGEIYVSAEKRAQVLVKNAELDAQQIQRAAREEASRLYEENAALRSKVDGFRLKYKQFLESELRRCDSLVTELFPELEMDDLKDLKDLPVAKSTKKTKTTLPRDDRKKTMVHIKK